MEGPSKCQQLQPEERERLASLRSQGFGVHAVGRMMGRYAGSISRELARNTVEEKPYVGCHARGMSTARRRQARPDRKLAVDGVRWGPALTLLSWNWSPKRSWDCQKFRV